MTFEERAKAMGFPPPDKVGLRGFSIKGIAILLSGLLRGLQTQLHLSSWMRGAHLRGGVGQVPDCERQLQKR